MKKILASLLISLAFAAGQPALAQNAPAPEHTAAIKELMDAMNYRTMMTALMQQMVQTLPEMMRNTAEQSISDNPRLDATGRRAALLAMEADLPKAVSTMQQVLLSPELMDEIMAEMIPLYARHFTVDEMRQIANFYRTPVGQKSLREMPQLMTEGMQIGEKVIGPRVRKAIESLKN
ncbi:DUF2059 domain-containing protein [Pseudoduganella violacea]|uniref:DUF2059 domain-containing protein n=1 Tax=Pseudoduganella violacea TaxID=1715466 RepID=A0A7W5FU39_9BURK|nr:DUF2059 domain-containing protein [Pseudoduganella violacea]MBB3119525.1 hypothetical protein [Pseudoduganella violacea]